MDWTAVKGEKGCKDMCVFRKLPQRHILMIAQCKAMSVLLSSPSFSVLRYSLCTTNCHEMTAGCFANLPTFYSHGLFYMKQVIA